MKRRYDDRRRDGRDGSRDGDRDRDREMASYYRDPAAAAAAVDHHPQSPGRRVGVGDSGSSRDRSRARYSDNGGAGPPSSSSLPPYSDRSPRSPVPARRGGGGGQHQHGGGIGYSNSDRDRHTKNETARYAPVHARQPTPEEGEIPAGRAGTPSTSASTASATPLARTALRTTASNTFATAGAGASKSAQTAADNAEPDEIDYDALYEATSSSATTKKESAAEERKRKRAAILAKHQQRLSATPQPEPERAPGSAAVPSGIASTTSVASSRAATPVLPSVLSKSSAGAMYGTGTGPGIGIGSATDTVSGAASTVSSGPGTPGAATGLQSAVAKLRVQSGPGSASPEKPQPQVVQADGGGAGAGAGADSPMRDSPPAGGGRGGGADSDSEDDEDERRLAMDTADLARLEQDEQLQLQRQRHGRDRDPHAQSQALAQAEIAGVAGSTSADALAGLSAADYDPDEDDPLNDDRRERERLFLGAAQQGRDVSRTTATAAAALGADAGARPVEQIIRVPAAALPPDASNGGDDEEDDEDDMFVVKKKKPRLTDPAALERELEEGAKAKVAFVPMINRSADDAASGTGGSAGAPLIVDNFDDPEGYYRIILGELLDNGRYHVHANLGKGMFSNVVRAKDLQSAGESASAGATNADAPGGEQREVAIKIVRSQESMYRAGQKEANILRKLMDADPGDKKHIIRLERTFEHRGHLCLVFESLSMNLRDIVKRFGKDVGINLKAVRAYAHQILLAMNLMKKLALMHADIKPDNILVNESKSVLKVCDLGSAAPESEAEITPYLVSRFYRAPEIILGLPYDCSLDMWAVACTLYELYTGKILFPGRSNNHMLLLIQELKGRYPARLVKKAKFGETHFEESNFVSVEKSKATGAESIKKVAMPAKPSSDMKTRLMPLATVRKMQEDEVKLLSNFVNLLERALELDPSKRLTPKEALNHPFLR